MIVSEAYHKSRIRRARVRCFRENCLRRQSVSWFLCPAGLQEVRLFLVKSSRWGFFPATSIVRPSSGKLEPLGLHRTSPREPLTYNVMSGDQGPS
jgi:hypothetical protein